MMLVGQNAASFVRMVLFLSIWLTVIYHTLATVSLTNIHTSLASLCEADNAATVLVVVNVIVGVSMWCLCCTTIANWLVNAFACSATWREKTAQYSHNVWKELVANQQEHIWWQDFPSATLQLHRAAVCFCSFLGDLPWVRDRQQGWMEPKDATPTSTLTPSGLVAQMTGLTFMNFFFQDNIVCLWGDFSNWVIKTQATWKEVGSSQLLISGLKSKI